MEERSPTRWDHCPSRLGSLPSVKGSLPHRVVEASPLACPRGTARWDHFPIAWRSAPPTRWDHSPSRLGSLPSVKGSLPHRVEEASPLVGHQGTTPWDRLPIARGMAPPRV